MRLLPSLTRWSRLSSRFPALDASSNKESSSEQGRIVSLTVEPMRWLTGGALIGALTLLLIFLGLLLWEGAMAFWPRKLYLIQTTDQQAWLVELVREETFTPLRTKPDSHSEGGLPLRQLLYLGAPGMGVQPLRWVPTAAYQEVKLPKAALSVELISGERFHGIPLALSEEERPPLTRPADIIARWQQLRTELDAWRNWKASTRRELSRLSERLEQAQKEHRKALRLRPQDAFGINREWDLQRQALEKSIQSAQQQLNEILAQQPTVRLTLQVFPGPKPEQYTIDGIDLIRLYPANQLSALDRIGVVLDRWFSFLTEQPRAANSAGGVMPALWGTIVMTLLMSVIAAPFGLITALHLREYARPGALLLLVRISLRNLAGVPSIVYGVFGLGFFCYVLGGYLDGGADAVGWAPWPAKTWWLAVALTAFCGTGAFLLGLRQFAGIDPQGPLLYRLRGMLSLTLWAICLVFFVVLIATIPGFQGLYRSNLPEPTFGTGGLLWASITMALLTLPVVVVSTEEALASVPFSLREGSYACGASQWQTIRRVVLPRALPGMLTGLVLAMARAAGEVAPLMLVGTVKLAPEVPWKERFPFVRLEDQFMHLGYHLFDVGFQSQNGELSRSLVFATALLLVAIVFVLNLSAVWLRAWLRHQYPLSA
ncbi:ABC transmembrane type-1 domain-containing protein [Planctomycetales bacterium 10988]|nr:ABC transmembrane type-1 domain-containing protein [Planctomycetales bacterium 10988]